MAKIDFATYRVEGEKPIGYLILNGEEKEAWIIGKVPPETELSDLYKEFPDEIESETFWDVREKIVEEREIEVENVKCWSKRPRLLRKYLTGKLKWAEKSEEEGVEELKEILFKKFMRGNIENYP